jgi:hypothetical protein
MNGSGIGNFTSPAGTPDPRSGRGAGPPFHEARGMRDRPGRPAEVS